GGGARDGAGRRLAPARCVKRREAARLRATSCGSFDTVRPQCLAPVGGTAGSRTDPPAAGRRVNAAPRVCVRRPRWALVTGGRDRRKNITEATAIPSSQTRLGRRTST